MRKGIHVFLTPFCVKPGRRMHFGFLRGKGAKGGDGQCVFICCVFCAFVLLCRMWSLRQTLLVMIDTEILMAVYFIKFTFQLHFVIFRK